MEEKRTRKRRGKNQGQQSQDASWVFPRVIRFGEKKIVMELLRYLEEGWMLRLGDESVQAQSADNHRSKKDSALKEEDMSYDPSDLFSAIKFFFEGGEMSLYCPSHPQNCFFIVNSWRFLATPPEVCFPSAIRAFKITW